MKLITFSLILILLIPHRLYPFENVSVSTSLTSSYAFYQEKSDFEDAQHFFEGKLLVDGHLELGENYQLQFKPSLRFDNRDRMNSKVQFRENDEARPAVTFQELTLTRYSEQFEISFGKQVFSWGTADLFNPTDNINPVDLLDPLNTSKLGQTSLSVRYLGESSDFHSVLLLKPTPSRLPSDTNRWFRSMQTIQDLATPLFGFTPDINIGDQIENDNIRFGFQLTSSHWLDGWDIELSYFHGYDPIGVYLPKMTSTAINLVRVFPEFDEYAIGFSTTFDEYEFHGMLSYHNTYDNSMDDDYITYLVGSRRTFYETPFHDFIEEIVLSIEYVKEEITSHQLDESNFIDSGFARTVTNSILANLDFKFSEDNSLQVNYIQNMTENDNYFSIETVHKLTDNFELSLQFDLLSGSSESFFGGWSNNDRFFIQSTYQF